MSSSANKRPIKHKQPYAMARPSNANDPKRTTRTKLLIVSNTTDTECMLQERVGTDCRYSLIPPPRQPLIDIPGANMVNYWRWLACVTIRPPRPREGTNDEHGNPRLVSADRTMSTADDRDAQMEDVVVPTETEDGMRE